MEERKRHFPTDFEKTNLVKALVALSDPNICMGDMNICASLINSSLYSYSSVCKTLIMMEGEHFGNIQKIRAINAMVKWIVTSKRKREFYKSIVQHSTHAFFLDIIRHDTRLAKAICKNLSISEITSLIHMATWAHKKHDDDGIKDSPDASFMVSRFLLSHNMKRLVKESTGTRIANLYKYVNIPELFTPSALKKIPVSRWHVVIEKQPHRWNQCSNITKINPLAAYTLIRKDPTILKKYPNLEDWKLKGSQWNKLVKNNPEVESNMPIGYEQTIAFLILKRR